MHTYVSQDFVTIRGPGPLTVSQGQNAWLELPDCQDAVAWLDVKEVTLPSGGTLNIHYQTATMAEESLFVDLSGPTITMPFVPSTGVTITPLLKDLLTVPLAQCFRWQLVASAGSAAWDITFRLFVAANSLKRRNKQRSRSLEKAHTAGE